MLLDGESGRLSKRYQVIDIVCASVLQSVFTAVWFRFTVKFVSESHIQFVPLRVVFSKLFFFLIIDYLLSVLPRLCLHLLN